jgi:hypothetical protein
MEQINYSNWPQVTMTQKKWNSTSTDYKNTRADGTKTMMVLHEGVTTLAVVTIKG